MSHNWYAPPLPQPHRGPLSGLSAADVARDLNGYDWVMGRWRFPEERYTEPTYQPVPQATYDKVTIRGDDLRDMVWNMNWQLAEADRGLFTFNVKANSGLVVCISPVHTDYNAYYIVLDDDAGDTFITKGPHFHAPFVQRTDYRMGKHTQAQQFWVTYDYGKIALGNSSGVVVEYDDQYAAPGYLQFGFGHIGRRDQTPVEVWNVNSYSIHDTQHDRRPSYASLPPQAGPYAPWTAPDSFMRHQ